jgi:hypothetical protein
VAAAAARRSRRLSPDPTPEPPARRPRSGNFRPGPPGRAGGQVAITVPVTRCQPGGLSPSPQETRGTAAAGVRLGVPRSLGLGLVTRTRRPLLAELQVTGSMQAGPGLKLKAASPPERRGRAARLPGVPLESTESGEPGPQGCSPQSHELRIRHPPAESLGLRVSHATRPLREDDDGHYSLFTQPPHEGQSKPFCPRRKCVGPRSAASESEGEMAGRWYQMVSVENGPSPMTRY